MHWTNSSLISQAQKQGAAEAPTVSMRRRGATMNYGFALSLVLAGFAVVGVFIEIPFVSDYAFWIVIAAYVILAATIG